MQVIFILLTFVKWCLCWCSFPNEKMQNTCKCHLSIEALELYFEFYISAQIHPNCFRRYTTAQLSDPICEYVEKYRGPREVLYRSLERLIIRIIETHRMYFNLSKSQTCYKRMVHPPLYVAARLAFRSNLPNSKLVARILSEIYRCDLNMRNLIIGAYMEPLDCVGICGLHPIYNNQEEGLQALRYYLHHANIAKKMFYQNGFQRRMVDLNLRIQWLHHPAVYAMVANSYDTFKLLLDHGTNLRNSMAGASQDILYPPIMGLPTRPYAARSHYATLRPKPKIKERKKRKGMKCRYSVESAIKPDTPKQMFPEKEKYRILFLREHPELSGEGAPCLMQLCRTVIRKRLYDNFQLPCGIKDLPISQVLKRYINLDYD